MRDYIKREDVISLLEMEYEGGWIPDDANAILKEEIVECIPAADVVEVVRCKDCDYWDDALEAPRDKGCYFCGCHGGYTRAEYYCADGERWPE